MKLWNWIKSLFYREAPEAPFPELARTAAEQCAEPFHDAGTRCILKVGHGGAHVFGTGPADVREEYLRRIRGDVEGTITGRLPKPPVLQNIPPRTKHARELQAVREEHWPKVMAAHDAIPRYEPARAESEPDLLDAALTSVLSTGAEIAAERAIESLFDGDSSSSPDTSSTPDSPPDDYSGGGGGFGGGGASGDW
jgi:uncharacterized membrane protein YgcG